MATALWTGGGNDGNWNTAANWSGGSGAGGKPGAADDVLINATNQDITGVVTGISITSLTVTNGYGGTIGSDGQPVTFTAVTGSIKYAGKGAACRLGSSGTVAAAEFSHVVGTVYLSSGTWTSIINTYGNLDISVDPIVTTLENIGGTITVGYNSTAVTTFYNSGLATFKRNVTTFWAMGGTSIQQDNGTTNYTLVTTKHIAPTATYNKQSGGTDVTTNIFRGGNFTAENNSGGATGTVALGTVNKRQGARTKTSAVPGVTFTVTLNAIGAGPGSDNG